MNNTQQKKFILPILVVLAILFTGCGNTTANSEMATTTPDASEAAVTEAPATEAPATEAPATEAPATETPSTEAPATEAPATEAPATWCVNEDKSLSSPTGKSFHFEEAFYGAKIEIISTHKDRALIKISRQYPEYGISLFVADEATGSAKKISSNTYVILDINTAFDTVYWYTETQDVWSYHWTCRECSEPVLFCKGAIALSPYTDESEGAIVPPGKGNWPYVKGLSILSPYGEGGAFKNPEPCRDK